MKVGLFAREQTALAGGTDLMRLITRAIAHQPDISATFLIYGQVWGGKRFEKIARPLLRLGQRWFWSKAPAGFAGSFEGVPVKAYRYADMAVKRLNLDVLIPCNDDLGVPAVGYLYDCQHKYLPHLFTEKQRNWRDERFRSILARKRVVIVTSQDTRNDVLRFYPGFDCRIIVLPFAPLLGKGWLDDRRDLLDRYQLPERFFLISNQFWKHKDHGTAFRALEELLREIPSARLVCTGDMEDFRDPDYPQELRRLIESLGISHAVTLLGFIPKRDQIEVMKHCVAVVQPTLFEGGRGGGSAADALALGCRVIASDIAVNRELPEDQVMFFNVGDPSSLAKRMADYWRMEHCRPPDPILDENHRKSLGLLGCAIREAMELAVGADRITSHSPVEIPLPE